MAQSDRSGAFIEKRIVTLDEVAIPVPVNPGLTRCAGKRELYSVDTYFRDSWEDLVRIVGPDAVSIASRHAFLLLKPDAVVRRRLSVALDWLAARGWQVVHAQRFRVNRWAVRAFWQYQWNTATRDRREMADLYMSATDSLVLVLRAADEHEWACATLTRDKGSSDPARCRPGQLRSALGTLNQQLNLVHSADEPADLVREIGICCTGAERTAVYRAMAGAAQADADMNADTDARRLASALESEHGAVDLSLAGTADRLRARVSTRATPAARKARGAFERGLSAGQAAAAGQASAAVSGQASAAVSGQASAAVSGQASAAVSGQASAAGPGQAAAVGAAAGRQTAAGTAVAAGTAAGRGTGWRELVALAEQAGVVLTHWERVVLGTNLLEPTLPHVVPLIPDASAATTP